MMIFLPQRNDNKSSKSHTTHCYFFQTKYVLKEDKTERKDRLQIYTQYI